MLIETDFDLGDIVYLKTDEKQQDRIVTKFSVSPNGVCYMLSCGTSECSHFAVEISKEKNFI